MRNLPYVACLLNLALLCAARDDVLFLGGWNATPGPSDFSLLSLSHSSGRWSSTELVPNIGDPITALDSSDPSLLYAALSHRIVAMSRGSWDRRVVVAEGPRDEFAWDVSAMGRTVFWKTESSFWVTTASGTRRVLEKGDAAKVKKIAALDERTFAYVMLGETAEPAVHTVRVDMNGGTPVRGRLPVPKECYSPHFMKVARDGRVVLSCYLGPEVSTDERSELVFISDDIESLPSRHKVVTLDSAVFAIDMALVGDDALFVLSDLSSLLYVYSISTNSRDVVVIPGDPKYLKISIATF